MKREKKMRFFCVIDMGICMKFANTNANDFEYKSHFNESMWKYTKMELIKWESAKLHNIVL